MGGLRTLAKRLTARGLAIAIAGGLVAAPMAFADPAPVYYPLPTATHVTAGTGMVTDPSGNVWFTADDSSSNQNPLPHPPIGKLVPSAAHPGTSDGVTLYRTPNNFANPSCCATFVRSLAFDNAQNRLWYVRSDGSYGFGDPSQMVPETESGFTAARLPMGIDLWGLAVNQTTHDVWFAEFYATHTGNTYYGDRLAHTDSSLGVTESVDIAAQGPAVADSRYDARPLGVSLAADGTPWFAESDAGNPGYRIAKSTGVGGGYVEYSLTCRAAAPCSGSYTGQGVTDTAVAPDGKVWFINQLYNTIGVFDGSSMTEYGFAAIDPALASGTPRQLRFAADGTLWVSESGGYSHPTANAIVRLTLGAGAPTANVFSTGSNQPSAIAPSVTGDLWFTATTSASGGTIGQLPGVIAGGAASVTPTPAAGAPTPTPIIGPGVTLTPTLKGVAKAGDPKADATGVNTTQICVGPPQDKCSLVYLLQTNEYVTGFPGSGSRLSAKPKTSKTDKKHQTIGSATAILNGGETRQITIPLTSKAKKALKKQGHIKATLTVSQVIDAAGHTKVVQTKQITFKYKKAKKGH